MSTDLPEIRNMLATLGKVLSEGIEAITKRECSIVVIATPRPKPGQDTETALYCHGASAFVYATALRVALASMQPYLSPEDIAKLDEMVASGMTVEAK